jgi:hypothetical protein
MSNVAGWIASILVCLTFLMKDMVPLRLVAVSSNIAFFIYGVGLGLTQVWLLHIVLLPINICRLWQSLAPNEDANREPPVISARQWEVYRQFNLRRLMNDTRNPPQLARRR